MMPGVTFDEIARELADAYEYYELALLVRTKMNLRLDSVTTPGELILQAPKLLAWANRRRRLVELVRVTAQCRPDHSGLQQIYERFGMGIPIVARRAGATTTDGPRYLSQGSLQELVQPLLGPVRLRDWLERLMDLEGRVCRITIGGNSSGTGFLVGPDAVLTAQHVLRSVIEGSTPVTDVECQFDYKRLNDGSRSLTPMSLHATNWLIDHSPPTPGEDEGDPDRDLPTEQQLDFAMVRLHEPIGARPALQNPGEGASLRGWIRIPRAAPIFRSPMPVLITQHPDGEPLMLAADTEGINQAHGNWLNATNTRIRYATNTRPGASGSPCFDFSWNLIAMHHYGDFGPAGRPRFNQGIPIAAIRRSLKDESTSALG